MRRVRIHADLRTDQARQMRWLSERGEPSWIENLIAGTRWVVRTLKRFPGVGEIVDAADGLTLRAIRYPRGPYVGWYIYDEADPGGDILLVRLFHERQERPEPDLARWPLPPASTP